MEYCGVAGRFGWAHGIGPAGVHVGFNIWMEFYTFLQDLSIGAQEFV